MEIITQLVTPFYLKEVDYEVLEFSVDRQVRYKTDGVLTCGFWGEKSTLTDSEHIKIAQSAVREARGRIKVFACAGSNDSVKSESMARSLLDLGVDGVSLTLPYYNKGKESEIVRLAVTVKNYAQDRRVFMFYDKNRVLGKNAESELIKSGVEIVRADGEWEKCCYDGDSFLLNALCVDSVLFSVLGNVFPSALIHIREKWNENRIADAVNGYFEVKDKMDILERMSVPALKYALSLWGLSYPSLRLPLIECDDDEKVIIRRLFD